MNARRRTVWLIWHTEYPDEGSFEVRARTPQAAMLKYLKSTGVGGDEIPELGAARMTQRIWRERRRPAARDVFGPEWEVSP